MNSLLFRVLAASLLAACTTLASAGPRLAVTPKLGSLGVGADLSIRVGQRLHVRVMGQQLGYDWSDEVDGVDYDATLDLQSFGAVVDLHPRNGPFRLSAGLLANGNELNTVAQLNPTTTYGIGTGSFTGAELGQVDGNVTFSATAPFAAIGWGNPFKKNGRLALSVDAGLVYQAIDQAQLRSTNPSASPLVDQQMEEEERRFRNDVSRLELYPVVSVGMSIRF